MTAQARDKSKLRSRLWFDNPDNPGMTALYLERYLNYGLTREELVKLIRAIDLGGQFYSRKNTAFEPYTLGGGDGRDY